MGTAHLMKYLILAVVGWHGITFLTGCDEREQAARKGEEVTRDSAGWQRLREIERMPVEARHKGGGPKGPVSSDW